MLHWRKGNCLHRLWFESEHLYLFHICCPAIGHVTHTLELPSLPINTVNSPVPFQLMKWPKLNSCGTSCGRKSQAQTRESAFWGFCCCCCCCCCCFVFCPFRAAPVAYGSSQARGRIGAVAPAYTTATATPDPSCVCNLHHSSQQRQILNPLSEGRDQTLNFMVPNRIHFRGTTQELREPALKKNTLLRHKKWTCFQWFNQVVRCMIVLTHKPAGGILQLDWMCSFLTSHHNQNRLLTVHPTFHLQKSTNSLGNGYHPVISRSITAQKQNSMQEVTCQTLSGCKSRRRPRNQVHPILSSRVLFFFSPVQWQETAHCI